MSATIKVKDVLKLLKEGYTRYSKDDLGYGSIQTKYGLTGVQVKELFSHDKLKARKTIVPKQGLVIIDDEEETEVPSEAEVLSRGTFTPVTEVVETAPSKEVVVTTAVDSKEELFK